MADKNYISHCNEKNVMITGETIVPPDDTYSDTLKFSNVNGFSVLDCNITGGKEDCVDIMRGSKHGSICLCELTPKGKYGVTIKGGVENITISDTILTCGGSETDIDIGNYENASTPRNQPVQVVTISNVRRKDGRRVRVRLLNCNNVVFTDGRENYDVCEVPSIFWKTYFWLRDKGIL
jgi:hypothetical protein